MKVWGIWVFSSKAAEAIGAKRAQVRAVVAAPSRAAAGRALAAAGFFWNGGQAYRQLAMYGDETGNELEVATCTAEPGQVFITDNDWTTGKYVRWPP